VKEPFIMLAGMTTLVTATKLFESPVTTDRIAALLAAGVSCGCYSWWKSRKRHADRTDTALWAVISMLGSMSLGWFGGPILATQTLFGLAMPTAAFSTWLLAMGGAPFVEWLLDGHAFKYFMKKFGGQDAID
jgi:hypothetical protein